MALLHGDRAGAALARGQLDALVAALPENWRYLTDCPAAIARTLRLPTLAVLAGSPARVVALVAPRVLAGEIASLRFVDLVVALYGEFHVSHAAVSVLDELEDGAVRLLEAGGSAPRTVVEALASVIAGLGLQRARLGLDDQSLARRLAEALPEVEWVPAAETFQWIRLVKTEEEIDRMGAVAAIAEDLESLALAAARPGCDWAEVVGQMPAEAARRGATFEFWSGGAGSHGGFLFPAVDQRLQPGDLIRLDLTVTSRGYASDTGRSASIGEPGQLATRRYAAIRSAVEAAIGEVRPGRTFAQVYAAAMKAANREMPELRRHHCGHSIGVLPYDGPLVAPGHDVVLEPGMTLNIEVPYYELGWGGLQLEETVLVTERGHSLLTHLPRDLAVLPDAA